MVNYIRKTIFIPRGDGQKVGVVATEQNQVVFDFGSAGRKYAQLVPAAPVRVLTSSAALVPADVGKTIVFDSTTSIIAGLPDAKLVPGGRLRFLWKQLTTASTGHGVSPLATQSVGGGVTALTEVVNKDLYSASGTDTVNDRLELVSDGTNWKVLDFVGAFTKEA